MNRENGSGRSARRGGRESGRRGWKKERRERDFARNAYVTEETAGTKTEIKTEIAAETKVTENENEIVIAKRGLSISHHLCDVYCSKFFYYMIFVLSVDY